MAVTLGPCLRHHGCAQTLRPTLRPVCAQQQPLQYLLDGDEVILGGQCSGLGAGPAVAFPTGLVMATRVR